MIFGMKRSTSFLNCDRIGAEQGLWLPTGCGDPVEVSCVITTLIHDHITHAPVRVASAHDGQSRTAPDRHRAERLVRDGMSEEQCQSTGESTSDEPRDSWGSNGQEQTRDKDPYYDLTVRIFYGDFWYKTRNRPWE